MGTRGRKVERLEASLQQALTGIFLLSAQRKVLFFNAGCEAFTGWTADDVVGERCDYLSEEDPTGLPALLAAMTPPPELWTTGKPHVAHVYLPVRHKSPQARLITFIPLADGKGATQHMLGLLANVPLPAPPRVSPAQQLHAELAALRQSLRQQYRDASLVGRGPAMQRVLRQRRLAEQVSWPVHLRGEPGTGKEHLARTIHYGSAFGKRTFVPLDAARLPLDEYAELFGRLFDRPDDDGAITTFAPGTIYLEHVEQLPSYAQALLQARLEELLRLADPPVRVITSSADGLDPAVASGRFLASLALLLTNMEIEIPPLRERRDDLPLLAQLFVEEGNRQGGRQVGGIADDVWTQLERYGWPGNVAELRDVIRVAREQAKGTLVAAADLPFHFRSGQEAQRVSPPAKPAVEPLEPLLERVEREQIELALQEARQNKSKAADLLGITRPRLYRRMEQLGIADVDGE